MLPRAPLLLRLCALGLCALLWACGEAGSSLHPWDPTPPVPQILTESLGVQLVDVTLDGPRLRGRLENHGGRSFDRIWLWLPFEVEGQDTLHRQPIQLLPFGDAQTLEPGGSLPFALLLGLPNAYRLLPEDIELDMVPIPDVPGSHEILSRLSWDPFAPHSLKGVTPYPDGGRGSYGWIVIHHSAYPIPQGPRTITRHHVEERGFADVGYHYIVDLRGNIYEGRDLAYMGAHAGRSVEATAGAAEARRRGDAEGILAARRLDPDWGSVGVVVDGYFEDGSRPPQAQLGALRWLVEDLKARFDIPPSHVIGHGEVKDRITLARGATPVGGGTACPGIGLRWLMDGIRGGV